MAKETIHKDMIIIEVSGKEAADLIGLLAAQLANSNLVGNMTGAAPSITITDRGIVKHKLLFCVERSNKNDDS